MTPDVYGMTATGLTHGGVERWFRPAPMLSPGPR